MRKHIFQHGTNNPFRTVPQFLLAIKVVKKVYNKIYRYFHRGIGMRDYEQLQKENEYLKKLLAAFMHQQAISDCPILTKKSPLSEKVNLLGALFKGRHDVYALKWEAKSGGKGYRPVAIKAAGGSRKYLPLTEDVFIEHILGEKTIGIYPLLKDNTCTFLALDFDKKSWENDILALAKTCKNYHIPHYIERSSSGNGAHIWFFFSTKIPAKLARKFGMSLMEKTAKENSGVQLQSFDRFFPNQDTMPEGGFGNLIALPLQREPGRHGNSLFIDENFMPHPDQWMYLSTVRKITKQEMQHFLRSLNDDDSLENMDDLEKLPDNVQITLKNGIHIKKRDFPSMFLTKILNIASFSNPNYHKAKNNRFPTYDIPKVIQRTIENQNDVILPRGCFQELLNLLKEHAIEVNIKDEQYTGETIDAVFHGTLSSQQNDAVETMLKNKQGVLEAATGFGKTVLAISIIAERKVNTLIIVHRKALMQQWIEKLAVFLHVPAAEIGQIGGGKNKVTGFVDVATIQSLNYKGQLKSLVTQYGQIIVDECHNIPAITFEAVLKQIRPQYVLGLTATPKRKDGMHPIITMQCGPVRYRIDAKSQAQVRPFLHRLVPRKTKFHTKETDFQSICNEIAIDRDRNQQIFNDVLESLEEGKTPIVLTNRLLHLEVLTKMFQGFVKNIIVLTGSMKEKDQEMARKQLLEIPSQEERLILATGQYIGEGFDDARLDTLFLTMPISWKGTLQQYVGRLHREYDTKQEVRVYDYVDANVSRLKEMYGKRLKGYKSMGYITSDEGGETEQMRLF